MACYHPVTIQDRGAKPGMVGTSLILVPCGHCVGCQLEKARQWAMRCVHEASCWKRNCFITLTYDNEHLPKNKSLTPKKRSDFTLFMKRLRKAFPNDKIRYFMAGEYGEKTGRPHYHAAIFNFDFPDKKFWKKTEGGILYKSECLNSIWGLGGAVIGDVTFESAAYIARYIIKKQNPGMDDDRGSGREKPYSTMSRRPGIGAPYWEQFGDRAENAGYMMIRGKKCAIPRFYADKIKKERRMEISLQKKKYICKEDQMPARRAVREEIQLRKQQKIKRKLEE